MASNVGLRCDGCGQAATPEHIARRLRRLEWATRYRPVHIQALLLGGLAPREDANYLYAQGGEFCGEAEALLRAVGISAAGKTAEAVHAQFQGAGLFFAHVLECPLEDGLKSKNDVTTFLREHLPAVASRIRRSLKPRRVMLVTEVPDTVVQNILALDLGCPVVLDEGKPFRLAPAAGDVSFSRLRALLWATAGK